MDCCSRTNSVKSGALLLAALTLCCFSGCYERIANGNESVYRFVWWLGPAVIVGGILGMPSGWYLRQWSPKLGFGLLVMAPLLLLVIAPAMYRDRVLIDDEHFEASYGFWFNPTVHNLRFDELREVQYVELRGRRGRTNYELRCQSKSGQSSVVHAGDLVRNAVLEILERAKANGVHVVNQVPRT